MGSLSIWHWLIVLVIVMLVFGTKKLRNIGQDLGGAVKGFKEGVKEGTEKAVSESEAADKSAPAKPAEAKKPAGMNFVFKIAPADPKNSFDFEDVADK